MRLLFVIDHFGSGGAQRQMVNLAIGLSKRGYKVEFFTYYPQYRHLSEELIKNNIIINEYQKKFRFDPRVFIELRSIIKKNNYNTVVSFLRTPNFYTEMLNLTGRGFTLVVSERSTYPYGRVSFGRKIKEQLHRFCTHITVNSYHHRDSMVRIHPWIEDKISTIYNGVDLDLYKPDNNFYKKLKSSIPKLLVLSSVRSLKNVAGLIQGLNYYKDKYGEPPIINWAGKVSNQKEDQKTFLTANKLIEYNGLSDYWNWLGERTDVVDLLRKHDALILASYYEGLPNAICEALACGKPVLASNVCDNPLLIQEGITGFLFNPHDPKDIAYKIHEFVCLNEDRRIEMGKNARKYAENNLSLNSYIFEYDKLLKSL